MKNSIKRAQNRAGSGFAERENFRPKVKQLKKTLLTLVALLAVTTGAWAQGQSIYLELTSSTTATIKYSTGYTEYSDKAFYNGSRWDGSSGDYAINNLKDNVQAITVDASCANFDGDQLQYMFSGFTALKTVTGLGNINMTNVTNIRGMFSGCTSLTSVDLSGFNTASVTNMMSMFSGCTSLTSVDLSGLNTSSVTNMMSMFNSCTSLKTLDLSSWNTSNVTNMSNMFAGCENLENIYVGDGWNVGDQLTSHSYMFAGCEKLPGWQSTNANDKTNAHTGAGGYLKTKPAGSVNLVWDAATKTATIAKMPAGNVTVSVEYCPYATLATDGVTANNKAEAQTDAQLVTVADQAATGGTLMYYVTTDGNFTQEQAIALAEDAWNAAIPTAENAEEGTVYVWYYIKGDADHSDTAPECIAVTVLPEPTYKVEFAEGTNEAPNSWTVDPAAATDPGVKKGTKVTLTYDGPRKVIGVKAEKKAKAYTMAADATAEDKGKLICTAGHIHAYGKDAECTATRAAMIIYVGTTGHATYTHGLALALEDVSSNTLSWDNSRSNNNSMTAAEWCSACNTSKAVTGATWLLASKDQWDYMLGANGAGSYTALRDGFTSVGGTNMQSVGYWSSTEDSSNAWIYAFGSGTWYSGSKNLNYNVRACIAF